MQLYYSLVKGEHMETYAGLLLNQTSDDVRLSADSKALLVPRKSSYLFKTKAEMDEWYVPALKDGRLHLIFDVIQG